MSAITFPNSPSAGEQHTINGITYTFTDGTWVAVGQSNFYTLPIASPTVLGGVKSGGTGIQIANDGVISIATGSTFDTNDVDAHLNQSNPTSGYVLSWNGTDYAWVAQTTDTVYANTDVDTHLNQSNPTSGYVLSWNGTDYAWVDNAGYSNTDVDTHLNQSNPTANHVLSWSGSDYAWVDASSLASSPIPAFQSNWRIPL